MSSDFKIGDTAYVHDSWWGVCKVEIKKIKNNIVWVNIKCSVDENGEPRSEYNHGGTVARLLVPEEEHKLYGIWHTAKEVYVLHEASVNNNEKILRDSIKTTEDLLRFPLYNCLCGDDYVDYSAIKIYKEKAKELFNIDL